MDQTKYTAVRNLEVQGFFVSRVKAFVALLLFLSMLIALVVLAALLAHEKGKEKYAQVNDDPARLEEESSFTPMSCDVVVVGGGISGLYMAETLMRMKKEDNVCLFEKESRFGGRDFDVRFSRAPNISISLGAWRLDREHKRVMDLARRFNIAMLEMGSTKQANFEARGVYASSSQSLKEQAFPTLLSGPFANMTPSEMIEYAWVDVTREKSLEVPSYRDFLCQKLGSEGCEFYSATWALKRRYGEESTLSRYERNEAYSYFSYDYLRPPGGISDIIRALEKSAKHFGVQMYAREAVKSIDRKGSLFVAKTDNFTVSTKKIIIAVPSFPFEKITGDVAADIKANYLFGSINPRSAFKAVAIYSYPWWENTSSSHNLTLKPLEVFQTGATCLVCVMPYSGRGPKGEAVIQLSYAWRACAVKWGELSKLPKAVFETEIKKAIQEIFTGMVVPEPLDIAFKYWENVAW
ncbi:putative flavin-containing monoamine oxidase AofH isoform X1 [Oculina patagonica]